MQKNNPSCSRIEITLEKSPERPPKEIKILVVEDSILSDVYIHEMDGIELCATLQGNPLYSHMPFVVMSTEKDAGNGSAELFAKVNLFILWM